MLRNERLLGVITAGDAPLTLDVAPTSDAVKRTARLIKWPEYDEPITREVTYQNDEDFAYWLTHKDSNHKKDLNNFYFYLQAKPARLDSRGRARYLVDGVSDGSESLIDYAYGSAPFLIRAYAAFPDFMTETRELMQEISSPAEIATNPVLVSALHTSYHLLARLIRADDDFKQARILGGEVGHSPSMIEDAHSRLRA